MLSDDLSWPFSFCNVCQALEIHAEALRRRFVPPLAARWGGTTAALVRCAI